MTDLVALLLNAQQDHTTLLERVQAPTQQIEVHQHLNRRWIYTGGKSIQSTIDLNHPAQLQQSYQEVMLSALVLNPEPKTILNLGYGGGGFERFFAAYDHHIDWTTVDMDPQLVYLTQKHMQVPQQWPVIIDSAENFLAQSQNQFELVLCDLFVGQYHAKCLEQAQFYQQLKQHLTSDGIIAVNLSPQSEKSLIQTLALTRCYFNNVMISKVAGCSNLVLLLSQQPLKPVQDITTKQTNWPLDFASLSQGFKPVS